MKSIIPGLLAISFLACAPAALEPPSEDDFELRMTATVAPGVESYACRLFQVPAGGLFVHEETVQFGPGGHHVLLYTTPYETIPEFDEQGAPVDAAAVHDCSAGVTARWKVNSVLGGSEIFGGLGMLRGLPPGVAVNLPGNTVLVMSVHYLNGTGEPIDVDARIRLSTMRAEDVTIEAGLLYLDHHLIYVPAMGTAVARMRCPIPSDVSIVNLQSHMHARGRAFLATLLDRTGAPLDTVYETTKWVEPPVKPFDPFLRLSAGQALELRCDYQSVEPRAIGYGSQSTDEMCQLIGPYFPRNRDLEACANARGEPAATWTGQGMADGKKTRECLECAPSLGGIEYSACVQSSCPAIAEQVSAAVRCQLTQGSSKACMAELDRLARAGCL